MTEEQKTHIKTWLANLRSGDYKQTCVGRLKDSHGYCCLGVGVDQMGAKWRKVKNKDCYNSDLSDSYIPDFEKWEEYFGFSPMRDFGKESHDLPYLNDVLGLTFLEIAAIIEDEFFKEKG